MSIDNQSVREPEKCSICLAELGDQICLHSHNEPVIRVSRVESTPAISNGDVASALQERPNTQPGLLSSTTEYTCQVHSRIRELYCHQCSCLVCVICYVNDHNSHKVAEAKDVQNIQQQAVIRNKLMDSCRNARLNLERRTNRIRDDIQMRFSFIREFLREKELKLLTKVDDCFKVQDQILAQHMKTLSQGSPFNCLLSTVSRDIQKSSKPNMVYCIRNLDQIIFSNLVGHLLQASPCIHQASTNLLMKDTFGHLKSLALNNSMVYVAGGTCEQSRISVFEDKSFKEAETSITLPVKNIYDMEVIGKTIFLTDLSTPRLYVLEPNKQLKTIKIDSARATLSTTVAGNVLVIQPSKLTHHFPSGTKLKEESLPWQLIEHAIEINQDEYVITEWEHGVLKIRGKEIMRRYLPDNKHGQAEPCYLATDSFHHVFVSFYKAKKIVILSSDLERIMSIDVNGWPWGVYVNKVMSHLYVTVSNNQKDQHSIEVYDLYS